MSVDERDVDWGATGRRDEYRAVLVDPFTLQETGDVELKDGSSSISYSLNTDNQLQATIDLADGDYRQEGYDRMVRLFHTVTIGGFSREYTMGTFFVSNLTNDSSFGTARRSLTCYGPMWRYTQDVLARDFVRHAGDNVVQCIRDIIQYDGGILTLGDGVDTSKEHTIDIFFEVGKSRAEVLETYASWINCEISTGLDGTIVLKPWMPPGAKEPVYLFEDGRNCVYTHGLTWETNRDEPTNRVVAYFSRESKQDDDPYPLADSVYVDLPATADFSYERSGRRRTKTLQVQDPCSHEDLTAQAQRYLDENSSATLDIEIEHAGVPFLRVGDVVEYTNRLDSGVERMRCQILEMSVDSLSPMCMTKTKMRVV